jgi:endogenous inhibitor of DNA gyrase (YacG/DUF329 family)
MTSPPEQILVECPSCHHVYEDWWRPSINLQIEDFDDEYLREASTATCPKCGKKVDLEVLTVEPDGTFRIGPNSGEG